MSIRAAQTNRRHPQQDLARIRRGGRFLVQAKVARFVQPQRSDQSSNLRLAVVGLIALTVVGVWTVLTPEVALLQILPDRENVGSKL